MPLNLLAFDDFNGQLDSVTIQSKVAYHLQLKENPKPQLVIINNIGSDTFAEYYINKKKHYAASWMGDYGYYLIYLPKSLQPYDISINTLDSTKSTSQIGIKSIYLDAINIDIVQAFKQFSYASHIRYQQYVGGENQKKQARISFKQAKDIFIKNQLNFYSALSSYEEAIVLSELNQRVDAIRVLDTSINYWNRAGLNVQKLKTLNMKGLTYWQISKLPQALAVYSHLIKTYEDMGDDDLLAMTLNNIGLIYWDKGEKLKAKEYYLKSLLKKNIDMNNLSEIPISKAVESILNNLAFVYDALGEPQQAEKIWLMLLDKFSKLTNKNNNAKFKNNLATLYLHKGNYFLAKKYLEDAIPIFEKSGMKKWLAISYYNLGVIYFKLGLDDLSEIQLKKSLSNINKVNNAREFIQSQMKLIELYTKQNDYIKSHNLTKETLILAKQINNPKIISYLHLNNFKIALSNHDTSQANKAINNAIKFAKSKVTHRLYSEILVNKAKLLMKQKQYQQAIKVLNKEVKNLKNTWDTKLLNTANNLLAQAYLKNNDLINAEKIANNELDNLNFYINSSNNNKIRSDLSRMLKQTLGIYNVITVLQEKAELGFNKTNQMLANFRAYKKKNKALKSSLSQDSIQDLLALISSKSQALENQKLSNADEKSIQNEIIEIKARLDFSFETSQKLGAPILTIADIQKKLNKNDLLVQYSISKSGGVSWWIGKNSFKTFLIDDIETLTQLIANARDTFLLKNNSNQNIVNLSQSLLSPLKDYNDIKNIVLVLDKPLNLIPFKALYDPRSHYKKYLADNSQVRRISSIESIKNVKAKKKTKALVIADPVFSLNDNRLINRKNNTDNVMKFTRLLGTKSEASNISKILDTTILAGFDANKSDFLTLDYSQYDILHFATHAFFHQNLSGLSALVLSQFDENGNKQSAFLRAIDITHLKLDNKLIILSGCETGVGVNDNALGLDGLTQSFIQAGAQSFIASLWKVDDRITEKIMVEFYRYYHQGLNASDALWQAQKIIKDNPRTRHPKFWAGWFLLTN